MDSSDADLLRRARQGHESAYCEMVDRYGDYLYRLAITLVGNEADAADVLQETFSGAFQHVRKFEGRASVKTWLSRILFRQAARCHRSRGRHMTVSLENVIESPTAAHRGGSIRRLPQPDPATRIDILAAIETLPPIHREVIVLRELQGMKYREIADMLDVPRGTVESRLFRAREMLKKQLKDYLSGE